jgi:CRISPR/Cas system endoribonuclease Cas6 (RAMP superfamily)
MTPKPAYEALMKLIRESWWTEVDAKTDATGKAPFRGFLGDYELEVSAPGRPAVRAAATLVKGEANAFEITLPAEGR